MPSISLPGTCLDDVGQVDAVAALRRFNRFYTRYAGLLAPDYMSSKLSAIEARILYEIATRQPVASKLIVASLGMDPGYLSRIVRRFLQQGWVTRERGADAREWLLSLTDEGQGLFDRLDRQTAAATGEALAHLNADDHVGLTERLRWIESRLSGENPPPVIRQWRPGDMGLVTAQQAVFYRQTYGWGDGMEALIGEICSAFIRDFRPEREQCWVAERHGEIVGSVFLVRETDRVARLRLLYVDASARGHGLGTQLVERCITYAQEAGYAELVLWTHTVLVAARKIYAAKGFVIEQVETHDEFGKPEQSESWRLTL